MSDVGLVVGMFKEVRSWIQTLLGEKRELQREEKNAIRALYVAANETQMYFNRLDRPFLARNKNELNNFQRDIEREEQLSRLWLDASIEVRAFNPELAMRCFEKAGYWTNPDDWSEEDVKRANISLKSMFDSAKTLMNA
ncbi:MAG TPA: hypothetical protein PLS93_18435 [Accumulibacter sp.]|nr:hypothetical protein [Accumulibacter sp.]